MKKVLFCSVMLMAVSMFARQYAPSTMSVLDSTTYYSTSDGVFGSATTHSDGSVFFFNSDGSSGEVKYIGGSAYVNYTDAPKSYYVTTPDTSFVRYTPEPESRPSRSTILPDVGESITSGLTGVSKEELEKQPSRIGLRLLIESLQ